MGIKLCKILSFIKIAIIDSLRWLGSEGLAHNLEALRWKSESCYDGVDKFFNLVKTNQIVHKKSELQGASSGDEQFLHLTDRRYTEVAECVLLDCRKCRGGSLDLHSNIVRWTAFWHDLDEVDYAGNEWLWCNQRDQSYWRAIRIELRLKAFHLWAFCRHVLM